MKNYKYQLEKYQNRSSRHECPHCHRHSFTYYVDDYGNIIDKSVGRCDHESSCGYHYTPKEWFKDNPENEPQCERVRRHVATSPRVPDFIKPDYVLRSASLDSSLVCYLCGLLSTSTIKRVWGEYGVGATKNQSVIFWQIDKDGNVRTGKVMTYDPETGHRIKDKGANWIHAIMKKKGLLPVTFNLVQCLFGEHLLKLYPDKDVALVESEKTALIGASVFPQYVWLATGGKSQMNIEKMGALKGRRVTAFPDVDGFNEWKQKCKDLARLGIVIDVSDVLERNATLEERERKIDIADWILSQLEMTSESALILERMIQANPYIGILVDKLNLEVA